jgi:hypothetical protein
MSKQGQPVKHAVRLSAAQRAHLETLIRDPNSRPQRTLKARILLKLDAADSRKGRNDRQIAAALKISRYTIYRVRRQLRDGGLKAALNRKPRADFVARLSANSEQAADRTLMSPAGGYLDGAGVRNLLWKKIVAEAGGIQTAWASRHRIPLAYFNKVLRGQQVPSKRVLRALDLEKVVVYRLRPKSRGGNNRSPR